MPVKIKYNNSNNRKVILKYLQQQYCYEVLIISILNRIYCYKQTTTTRSLRAIYITARKYGRGLVGWLFWVKRPFKTVFQFISGRLPKSGRKRREKIDESKNVQTTPTRTYCKRSKPLPYCNPNCRTPRHWKFTQHHRTTQPPPKYGWLVGCFGFNGPLRQYFSLYRAVSQREGKSGEKG